jgi:hypothetical protein
VRSNTVLTGTEPTRRGENLARRRRDRPNATDAEHYAHQAAAAIALGVSIAAAALAAQPVVTIGDPGEMATVRAYEAGSDHHLARGLTALQSHQLEFSPDSGAWVAGHATVPAASTSTAAAAVTGPQRLVELGLADGAGSTSTGRWRVTSAGHELVMQTRGPARDSTPAICHAIAQRARQDSAAGPRAARRVLT